MQDAQALANRGMLVPVNEAGVTLPVSSARGGKALGFDANGLPIADGNFDLMVSVANAANVSLSNVSVLTTLSALRALAIPQGPAAVLVQGGAVAGDGGEAIYRWEASSTAADDGSSVIMPDTAPASGRWLSLIIGGGSSGGSASDASAITYTAPFNVAVTRSVQDWMAESISPKDYGATVGTGDDDTAALTKFFDAWNEKGGLAIIPPGEYATTATHVLLNQAYVLRGAGAGQCKIRFIGANNGLIWRPASTGNSYTNLTLSEIALIPGNLGQSVAVDVDLPDGVFMNNARFAMQNCMLYAEDGSYFGTGLRLKNVGYGQIENVQYRGSSNDDLAGGNYYAGIFIDQTTQLVADDPALGVSLEMRYMNLHAFWCDTAIKVRGFTEGVTIAFPDFVSVRRGVDAQVPVGTLQPRLEVAGGGISAIEKCIHAEGYAQSQVQRVHLGRAAHKTAWNGAAWTGIDAVRSPDFNIIGNVFPVDAVDVNAGVLTCVRTDDWRTIIAANNFHGRDVNQPTTKDIDTVIELAAGSTACKVSGDNIWGGRFTNALIDNGTNNEVAFTPETQFTVQAGGVDFNLATKLINFGTGFAVSGTGNAVTIDATGGGGGTGTLHVQANGVTLNALTTLIDFDGFNTSVTGTAVAISPPAGSILVQDNGVTVLSAAQLINFGQNLNVSFTGNAITVDATGTPGPQGPSGPTGAIGPQGPQGPQGVPGANTITVQDGGTTVNASATLLDFSGFNIAVTGGAVSIAPQAGSVHVQVNGATVHAAAQLINFSGPGVSASVTGNAVAINFA